MKRISHIALGSLALLTATTPLPALYAATYMSSEQACSLMFPGKNFSPTKVTLTDLQSEEIEKRSGVAVAEKDLKVYQSPTRDSVFIDHVIGKHEYISYAVGISPDGKVHQIEILEYLESYGDEVREEWWREQFVGKSVADSLKVGSDIKNISGATFSSKHVTEGVRRIIATYEVVFHGN